VAGFSDFAATFLGVWSILSSGLKPFFLRLCSIFGRNYGRRWKRKTSLPSSEKPMYNFISRDFMEVEEKLNLFLQ